jgi:hypothetical protein
MEQAKQELTARSRSSSTTGCRQTRLCLPGSSTARPVTKAGLFRLEQAMQAQIPAIIEQGQGLNRGVWGDQAMFDSEQPIKYTS